MVFREVVGCNEYSLPPRFGKRDVVIDVGAHIGIVAAACLARGAGHVVAIEPDEENFTILCQNMRRYRRRAVLINAACWHDDALLPFTGYPDGLTACGSVIPLCDGQPTKMVRAIPLDAVLAEIAQTGRRVRLLKIDVEGAEFPILGRSRMLGHVDEIVCEVHERNPVPPSAWTPGFFNHDANEMAMCLGLQGFYVRCQHHHDALGARCSLLFAKRH